MHSRWQQPGFRRVLSVVVYWLGMFGFALCLACCDSGGDSFLEQSNQLGIMHIGNGFEPEDIDPHLTSGNPELRIQLAPVSYNHLTLTTTHHD